jgi:hypothetical protein
MFTSDSVLSWPHLAPPDVGGSRSDAPSSRLRAQFGLNSHLWPVFDVRPGGFTIQGEAAAPGTTTTVTLICADTLTVSVRAWAHPARSDGFQRFSIVEADDELASLLLKIAR